MSFDTFSFQLHHILILHGSKSSQVSPNLGIRVNMMTHCEDPWCEKRENIAPFLRSTEELSLDTMYSYYKKRYDNNRKL